jgi:hypothetical protein
MASNQGLTVTWNTSNVGKVAGGNFEDALTTVDCTTLDDDQVDNRADLKDPSGTIDISLKDNNTLPFDGGDIGILGVDGLSGQVLIQSVGKSMGVGEHKTQSVSFVSSLGTVTT